MTMQLPADAAGLPNRSCEMLEEPEVAPEIPDSRLDDATIAYVMAARQAFDGLRRVEGQLAGVLVLAAAGGRSAAGHPVLAIAWDVWAEAADTIGSLTVPPAGRHHYRHLRRAAACIGRAMSATRRLSGRNPIVIDATLGPLRAAHRELQCAAAALPGFEIVAFQQGCCAIHSGARRICRDNTKNLVAPAGWRRW